MENENPDYWKNMAEKYDAFIRFLNKNFIENINIKISPYIDDNKSILELAAGTGLISQYLIKSKNVVITDYSNEMLQFCKKRLETLNYNIDNIKIEQANIYELSYQPFDIIVSGNLIHLLDDPIIALNKIKDVLKDDGILILPTFCHSETYFSLIVSYIMSIFGFPVIHRFSKNSLTKCLKDSGFHVISNEIMPGIIPICLIIAKIQK